MGTKGPAARRIPSAAGRIHVSERGSVPYSEVYLDAIQNACQSGNERVAGISADRAPRPTVPYCETALSAFTWPWPLNELSPVPPVHTCAASFDTDGKGV